MKRFAMSVCVLLAALPLQFSQAGANASAVKESEHKWLTEHPVIVRVQELINAERARYGLHPVEIDPYMCLKAQEHAVWMAQTGYYQHSNLPWPEIIFYGPATPEAAVQGWIYSGPHHGIMLSGATKAGFGYMVVNGRPYWVGVFQ